MGGLEKFVLGVIGNYTPEVEPFVICLEQKGVLGQIFDARPVYEFTKKSGIDLSIVKQLYDLVKEKEDRSHTYP